METLFMNVLSVHDYKEFFRECWTADHCAQTNFQRRKHNPNFGMHFEHHVETTILLTQEKTRFVNVPVSILPAIQHFCFLYVDKGEHEYDDRYYFAVGVLNNGQYFSYEAGCSGTGFGFAETTKICISKDPCLLAWSGLTDKQREYIQTYKKTFYRDSKNVSSLSFPLVEQQNWCEGCSAKCVDGDLCFLDNHWICSSCSQIVEQIQDGVEAK